MPNTFMSISSVALVTISLALPAHASETGTIEGAKTTGALTFETRGLATSTAEVRRQGGYATAGTARWTRLPEVHAKAGIAEF